MTREFTTKEILGMDPNKIRDYIERNNEHIEQFSGNPAYASAVADMKEHNQRLKWYLEVQREHGR